MTIIRQKTHAQDFVILHKQLLNDPSISLKAKGLWAYLMGLPDEWNISSNELSKHSTDGRDSILAALSELVSSGYAEKTIARKKGVFSKGGWVIYESKKRVPQPGFPATANPTPANPVLISTEGISNEKKEKKVFKEKSGYGEEGAVKLTEDEHKKLVVKFGQKGATERILNCSLYLLSKGDKYKSHYHTLLGWEKNQQSTARGFSKPKVDRRIYDKDGKSITDPKILEAF